MFNKIQINGKDYDMSSPNSEEFKERYIESFGDKKNQNKSKTIEIITNNVDGFYVELKSNSTELFKAALARCILHKCHFADLPRQAFGIRFVLLRSREPSQRCSMGGATGFGSRSASHTLPPTLFLTLKTSQDARQFCVWCFWAPFRSQMHFPFPNAPI
jgi:hypothetical protein